MKKYISEAIGTMVLVILGCGSAVAANTLLGTASGVAMPLAWNTLLIAFAFGLGLISMAYSIGNVSGCHINPAVSLAMLINGRISVRDFIGYVVSQFIGGIAGAGILCALFGSNVSLGQNGFGGEQSLAANAGTAILVEVVLTFIFVLLILGVTSKSENSRCAGLMIGLTLTVVHILGIPFTGTSVNPARSFGPALLAGGTALSQVWVFILAPLAGAAIAAVVWRFISSESR